MGTSLPLDGQQGANHALAGAAPAVCGARQRPTLILLQHVRIRLGVEPTSFPYVGFFSCPADQAISAATQKRP